MHNVVGFLDEHYLRLSARLTLRGGGPIIIIIRWHAQR